jgi:riboflavin synthase
MFTGLVQARGRVLERRVAAAGVRLTVRPIAWDYRPALGESVCVSGCCLTVAGVDKGAMAFDAVSETLAKTTVGGLDAGMVVNLERAVRASDLLGGHIVQGHVDGVGEVVRVHTADEHRVRVRVPSELIGYLAPKGSIAMDGVSLTLASVDVAAGAFEVALIPVTLTATTLGDLREGSRVNLEVDPLAKTIVHYLRHFGAGGGPPPA